MLAQMKSSFYTISPKKEGGGGGKKKEKIKKNRWLEAVYVGSIMSITHRISGKIVDDVGVYCGKPPLSAFFFMDWALRGQQCIREWEKNNNAVTSMQYTTYSYNNATIYNTAYFLCGSLFF